MRGHPRRTTVAAALVEASALLSGCSGLQIPAAISSCHSDSRGISLLDGLGDQCGGYAAEAEAGVDPGDVVVARGQEDGLDAA